MQRCSHSRASRSAALWLGLLAAAAACTDQPTEPRALPRPAPQVAVAQDNVIVAQDLGTLPGDAGSEATYITEDGVVYGKSYPGAFLAGTPRFFRWTQAGGMTQVSSIPTPPAPPLPTIGGVLPSPYAAAFAAAANAKGEATGKLCVNSPDCASAGFIDNAFDAHVFRYSRGAGVVELDTRRDPWIDPPVLRYTSHGRGINRWGHVVGAIIPTGAPEGDTESLMPFFWTPLTSFTWVFGEGLFEGTLQVNDVDQFIGSYGSAQICSFVWRPDLGYRLLTAEPCPELLYARPIAQQVRGTWVVGTRLIERQRREETRQFIHAALWRVPALNRAAFPSVNANPYDGPAGRVRLSNGGWYFQLYRATQASPAGPYVELVDWGDGTTSRRTRSGIGGVTSQQHVYAAAGTYWVRVYVQDAQGRWGVDERKLVVVP